MTDTAATRAGLRALAPFASWPESTVDAILAFSQQRRVRAGETVFCQGEPSPYFFGILRGEVLISWVTKDGLQPPTEIAILKSGDFFGESALFSDSPRAAMASARQDGELLLIQGKAMRTWLEAHPSDGFPFFLQLMGIVLERYRITLPKLCLKPN